MDKSTGTGFWLSPAQKTAWITHQQFGIGNAVAVLCLKGPLDISKLRTALSSVVARHDILRTCYRRPAGVKVAFQTVWESCDPAWLFAELEANGDAPASAFIKAERRRVLNLEGGPVLVARLSQIQSDAHLLSITLSSASSDLFTLERIVHELGITYADRQNAMPAITLRFAQIAQWQNDLIEGVDADRLRARQFWSQFSDTNLRSLKLPGEKATSEAFRPDVIDVVVEPATSSRLLNSVVIPKASAILSAANHSDSIGNRPET